MKYKDAMKYKNSGNKIGRRNFLAASAATVLGYSAIITAPQVLARPLPTDENSKRLAKLQPKSQTAKNSCAAQIWSAICSWRAAAFPE